MFPMENIYKLTKELTTHPVYEAIEDTDDLSIFMQHHVYSVWDFMSLVKYLQNNIAPSKVPWIPVADSQSQRFINEIVLAEESDKGRSTEDGLPSYSSHFKLYIAAMEEVQKGSSNLSEEFLSCVSSGSLSLARDTVAIPSPSKEFMDETFSFIDTNKVHIVAAAFTFGREHIIPDMFSSLLQKMKISENQAPSFHHYLDRHIELDGNDHGPMAIEMLNLLCENNPNKIREAEEAALRAIKSRIKLWDNVYSTIKNNKKFLVL